jgi:hypothetical protein
MVQVRCEGAGKPLDRSSRNFTLVQATMAIGLIRSGWWPLCYPRLRPWVGPAMADVTGALLDLIYKDLASEGVPVVGKKACVCVSLPWRKKFLDQGAGAKKRRRELGSSAAAGADSRQHSMTSQFVMSTRAQKTGSHWRKAVSREPGR